MSDYPLQPAGDGRRETRNDGLCANCEKNPSVAIAQATLAGTALNIFCERCVERLRDEQRKSPTLTELLAAKAALTREKAPVG